MNWIKKNKWQVIGTLIGLGGFVTMATADWRIAAGAYLCIWGNNMARSRW